MTKLLALSSAALAVGFASTPAAGGAGSKPRTAPVLTGTFTPPALPTFKSGGSRGSVSPYPFNDLAVGQAFGVKNKDADGMRSIVSNQNRKHKAKASDGSVTVTKLFKQVNVSDLDADYVKTLKGTPLEGAKCLVFRVDPANA